MKAVNKDNMEITVATFARFLDLVASEVADSANSLALSAISLRVSYFSSFYAFS